MLKTQFNNGNVFPTKILQPFAKIENPTKIVNADSRRESEILGYLNALSQDGNNYADNLKSPYSFAESDVIFHIFRDELHAAKVGRLHLGLENIYIPNPVGEDDKSCVSSSSQSFLLLPSTLLSVYEVHPDWSYCDLRRRSINRNHTKFDTYLSEYVTLLFIRFNRFHERHLNIFDQFNKIGTQ
uniref:Uncharacterized protein n=1 Tax=Heterorhabditis bacteriophora TaxID=37862 RepID=A0A1I7W7T2_HETBA